MYNGWNVDSLERGIPLLNTRFQPIYEERSVDMNDNSHESDTEIAAYWADAATASGKIRNVLRIRFKRYTWIAVVRGASFLKRVFDIAVSGVALICLSPIFAATALLIKIEDRGPIFFKQNRIGY